MIYQKLNKILLFLYIISAIFIKYYGFFMPLIPNTQYHLCYKNLKKIAKNNKKSNLEGIIIQTKKTFKTINIKKKIIGGTLINGEIFFIDSMGKLFQSNDEELKNYITILGEYKYWHLYYKELEKYPNFLKQIYHVTIYHHRIDLYLLPGILLKLNKSIKDGNDFYEKYPKYFKQKDYYIDLRNTQQIAYGKLLNE